MAFSIPGYGHDRLASSSTARTLLYALLAYLVLVRLLRYRFRDALTVKYPYKSRASFRHMTNEDATQIQLALTSREFPFTFEKALQFALFRTYAIPSISHLLVLTKQLSSTNTAGKRYSDTEVLIQEFMTNEPRSQRSMDAIARMNYIHSLYQKQGLISNDDLLYTLSLFMLEPQRWIARYEWRTLTDLEICALGVFWKALGDAMKIDLSGVYECGSSNSTSSTHGGDPRQDGFSFFWALDAWSKAYEERTMVPAITNKQTADETVSILLIDVPKSAHTVGKQAVAALMDARLRTAMMIDAPPPWLQTLITSSLMLRKYCLRFLALPRPNFLRMQSIDDKPDKNGRLHLKYYTAEPFYVRDTFSKRFSAAYWLKSLLGNPTPGPTYRSEGYLIPEVGPRSFEGKGVKEQQEGVARLKAMNRSGCPFKA